MKILKLLNRNSILIIFFLYLIFPFVLQAEDAVDIWKLKDNKVSESNVEKLIKSSDDENISTIQINEDVDKKLNILEENELETDNINLVGIYDPEEHGLSIDMWSNSKGDELRSIFNRIRKLNLSADSNDILDIVLLTNSYFPNKDITGEEFLEFKLDYLIKKNDQKLIKNFLKKNKKSSINPILIKNYLDTYLSTSNLKEACSIFNEIDLVIDDYLTKFQIYCLINEEKREEAQLIYDLKKELGLEDKFFEKKFNILMGYDKFNNEEVSEKNILEFHLSHRTDPNFSYQPNENTSETIWKYLSTSSLLEKIDFIDLEDEAKINIIEKATHQKNYTEKELFDLYKRFQFNINQLLTVKNTYKLLPSFQGRALLYQRLILTIDPEEKIDLSSRLKKSFIEDNIENAFTNELSKILTEISIEDVPSNFSTFYDENVINESNTAKKIRYNNKIIHQSKLLKYFSNESSLLKIEKDTNDLLKKIKKDKKYLFTTKDIIMLESLKSDGIKISKNYVNLYEVNLDIPTDIQLKISNKETGMTLLRIVEIIGEDSFENLGTESLNFIINVLNQLNMDKLRNKIILKVLPLKV